MPIENAIDILKSLCPTVMQQGGMRWNERYPDRFFTFWNGSTNDQKHYDNAPSGYVWEVDFNFYSTDPKDVYNTLKSASELLQAAGWVISGKGHAVASDINTHTGRGFTALYLEIS